VERRVSDALHAAATDVLEICRTRGLTLATAESCTGGLVVGALTDIAGSSDVVDCGFVTYSNDAKQQMPGVPAETLKTFGAVSRETAEAMALGALSRAEVDLAVAITGIAGPGGATAGKPVGMVCIAFVQRGHAATAHTHRYAGTRADVRTASVRDALLGLTRIATTRS
jgi:nicotinamide-nucleotide amidase